ncbi:MAG: phosphoribosylaminoimidazolecarboxamide formyltransferase / cyclohydrolase [Candidatus Poribacteria bacterium]|nr:phosphoribosylaminoimidazolecarboxamide formyltransferase / cyclohydrolase [Candidatus Poribacteria bacterium]
MSNEIELRYGCNPHQKPAKIYVKNGKLPISVRNGSPGYINVMDAINSWQLVRELKQVLGLPSAASFKHVSPAGAAVAVPLSDVLKRSYFVNNVELSPLATAYARARGADMMSSYGDFAALSDRVDVPTAQLIRREVSDGVIAPGYDDDALAILKEKRGGKYLVLEIDPDYNPPEMETKEIFGITLEQRRNDVVPDYSILENIVTENKEIPDWAKRDLIVATIAVKYIQSNSICFAYDGQVTGVGAGQQSRVHCVRLAATKSDIWYLRQHPVVLNLKFKQGISRTDRNNAIDKYLLEDITEAERKAWETFFEEVPKKLTSQEKREWISTLKGVSLSSDAMFPFRDSLDRAAQSGVKYVVQAGSSIRDNELIQSANEYGMVMALSKLRLFHH